VSAIVSSATAQSSRRAFTARPAIVRAGSHGHLFVQAIDLAARNPIRDDRVDHARPAGDRAGRSVGYRLALGCGPPGTSAGLPADRAWYRTAAALIGVLATATMPVRADSLATATPADVGRAVAATLWYGEVAGDAASATSASNVVFFMAPNADPNNVRGL